MASTSQKQADSVTPVPGAKSGKRKKKAAEAKPEAPKPVEVSSPAAEEPPERAAGQLLITGVARGIGRLLLRRLLDEGREIVGIDSTDLDDLHRSRITFHKAELKQRKAEDVFRSGTVDTVIHLAFKDDLRINARERYHYNVVGTMKLLDYCERYGVRRVVVLSSANVYGAHPENPILMTEESPLRASEIWSEFRDRVGVDRYAMAWMWKNPEVHTIILRPVHILGPSVHNAFVKYLQLPIVPVLLGFNPMVQIIHEEDVVEALATAADANTSGIYNLVGPGALPLRRILWEIGAETLPIPHPIARQLIRLFWFLSRNPFPEAVLDFVRYPCIVSGEKIRRELGVQPRTTLGETLRSLRALRK